MTNEIVTNLPPLLAVNPSAVANDLRGWIGVAAILGMALIHGYQIVVNAGGLRTIWKNFLGAPATELKETPASLKTPATN
jgi:hypothetical protein